MYGERKRHGIKRVPIWMKNDGCIEGGGSDASQKRQQHRQKTKNTPRENHYTQKPLEYHLHEKRRKKKCEMNTPSHVYNERRGRGQ